MERRHVISLIALSVILAMSSIFQMGYANAYPNTAVNSFRIFLNESDYGPFTEDTFTWVWSAVLNVYFIGFIVGSVAAVPLADYSGRKWCLLFGNTTNFVAAVLSTLSTAFLLPGLFVISRVVFAVAAGISMNSLVLLLQESAPVQLRGLMSFNAEMAFVATNMLGALAGMRTVLGTNLVWLTGLACIPALLSVFMAIYFPDSPRYLLNRKKNRRLAEKSVQFYHGSDEQETSKVLTSYEKEADGNNGSLRELVSTKHVRFGLFLVVGMIMIERYPRRRLLLSCGFANMGALTLFVVSAQLQFLFASSKYGCIVAVVLHGISYSIALGPISWFITAELVPLQFRALSQSLALSFNQTAALILCFITLPLYDKIGSYVLLPLFVVPGLLAMTYLALYLPETRSKHISEVIAELKGSKKNVVELTDQPAQL
ncbi:unnamed protein product [Nippostrongylus brasiliensis]|uniref:MFS domain-containing protein n=1 Tax=Nippostrongylus brasiliensis TaxID=27835 RepID=A0A0N4XVG0_NIPBR|nr:unnamed protein product [Nippostrongylus brasiliensis]